MSSNALIEVAWSDLFRGSKTHYIEAWHLKESGPGKKADKRTSIKSTLGPRATVPVPIEKHIKGSAKVGSHLFVDKYNVGYGAIDIDIYPTNHKQVIQELKNNNIDNAVIVKSTSGGCHLFFFFEQDVIGVEVRERLKHIAKLIGHEGVEVFPKQNDFDPVWNKEKNEGKGGWDGIGNAIYWPYGPDNSCGLDDDGKELSIEDFLNHASGKVIKDFNSLPKPPENKKVNTDHRKTNNKPHKEKENYREVLKKGPPCLATLNVQGIPEGGGAGQGRDRGMYNYAVLLKQANGIVDLENLEMFNTACNPPLSQNVLDKIMNSVNSSEYFYSCKEEPIKEYCKKEECRTKKYGIGSYEIDIERYPYTYIYAKDWFADNKTGSWIKSDHFQNICDALKFKDDEGNILNRKEYLRNFCTEKVSDYGFNPTKSNRYKKEGKVIFNSYRKPPLEPEEGDIQPWLDVIEDMVPDKRNNGLLHSWIWHLMNFPGKKMKWSPIIITPKGRGKDLVARGIKPSMGIDYTAILDMKLFKQQHTGHLFQKVIGIVSETKETGKDRAPYMETLKPLITDPEIKIRAMHKDAFWVENVINFIFFSNHDNALTLDMDERRFMVLKDDKKRKPKSFYAPCWDLVEQHPGIILNYYLNEFKPVEEFNPVGDGPTTEFLQEISDDTDNPNFIALNMMFEQRIHPFDQTCHYINVAHLAEAFSELGGNRNKFDIPMILLWCKYRKKNGKAINMDKIDIDWYGERVKLWSLDPSIPIETDRQKLREIYRMPKKYGWDKWDKKEGEKCSKCNQPLTKEGIENIRSPF